MFEKDEFTRQFRELNPKFSRLQIQILNQTDLTVSQYALLNQLVGQGPIPMTELSAKLHISKPAVTHLVDQLERKKCLRRVPHPKDRRIYLIEAHPKAEKIVRQMQSYVLNVLLTTLDQFSSGEQKIIREFYSHLSQTMDKVLGKNTRRQTPDARCKTKLILLLVGLLSGVLSLESGIFAAADIPDIAPMKSDKIQIENIGAPLTLEECYKLALNRMETIGIKAQDIEVAKAQFFKATGTFFGDIDFIKYEFFQDGGGPAGAGGINSVAGTFNAENRRQAQFTITQPFFQGGKSLGALTGVGAFKKQKKDEYIRSKQTLFSDVSNAFYNIIGYKQDIATIEEILKLFNDRVTELKQREDIGRSRTSEVVNAVSRMKNLEGDLARSRGGLQVARCLLEFLTGISIDINHLEEEDLESIINRDPNDFLKYAEKRPDVTAAKNAEKVAWDQIIVAQSAFWPTLNMTYDNYELREGFQSGVTWDYTLQMDVPLFRGGTSWGTLKESIAKWKIAKLTYSQTKRQAELEIKQAYEEWYASYQQYKAFAEAVKESNENFRLQKEDYTRSLVSNLDVLDALEQLNTNRRQTNLTYYQMKKDYWKLKVAIGEVL